MRILLTILSFLSISSSILGLDQAANATTVIGQQGATIHARGERPNVLSSLLSSRDSRLSIELHGALSPDDISVQVAVNASCYKRKSFTGELKKADCAELPTQVIYNLNKSESSSKRRSVDFEVPGIYLAWDSSAVVRPSVNVLVKSKVVYTYGFGNYWWNQPKIEKSIHLYSVRPNRLSVDVMPSAELADPLLELSSRSHQIDWNRSHIKLLVNGKQTVGINQLSDKNETTITTESETTVLGNDVQTKGMRIEVLRSPEDLREMGRTSTIKLPEFILATSSPISTAEIIVRLISADNLGTILNHRGSLSIPAFSVETFELALGKKIQLDPIVKK